MKGLVWLASRHLLVGGVSRTRWQNACGAAGVWWDALPREEWPQDEAALHRMQQIWREPYGDRRQELVLVGDPAFLAGAARTGLDGCLLNDAEFSQPVAAWSALPDPFRSGTCRSDRSSAHGWKTRVRPACTSSRRVTKLAAGVPLAGAAVARVWLISVRHHFCEGSRWTVPSGR